MAELSGNGSAELSLSATCDEYKENLMQGLAPYEILNFITPRDSRVWMERSDAWIITMGVYVGMLSLVYLMLGTASFVLIFKRDCMRHPTKTFFAVYLMLGVLGFTRAFHLLLDPYGLFGFIIKDFSRWIIISRVFALSGFPSLVACCTLIIFTLWKLRKVRPGNQWYNYWRYIIPLAVTPYIIAVTAEIISYLVPYPALISIVICEAFFTVWGITICVAYLFTGVCLLKEVKSRARRTMRTSESVPNTEEADKYKQQRQKYDQSNGIVKKTRKKTMKDTIRKISIITSTSAILGIIYSLFTGSNLTVVCLLVFHDCLGFNDKKGNSALWLGLQAGTRITEVLLACVIFYSITDMTLVVKFMKHILLCGSCRNRQVAEQQLQCGRVNGSTLHNLHSNNNSQMSMLSSAARQTEDITIDDITSRAEIEDSNEAQNVEMETRAEVAIEMPEEDIQVVVLNEQTHSSTISEHKNPRVFMLNAQTDSNTSIETPPFDCKSPSRLIIGEPHTVSSSEAAVTISTDTSELNELKETDRHSSPDHPLQDEQDESFPPSGEQQSFTVDERTAARSLPVTIVTAAAGGTTSVATQTVEQRSIACQTEPPTVSQKPVPKPRTVLPSKTPKQHSRRQRFLKQKQLQKNDPSKSLFRKQTV